MKKLIGLILALMLVLTVAGSAFAAGKPKITRQPESATVKANGTVSFSVKTSGTVSSITWYFVNPATGEKFSGRKLDDAVKGVVVQNPNRSKITLKKVPETMHGWLFYAHINGNGYKIDSDQVQLLISGMDIPGSAPASPSDTSAAAPAETATEAPAAAPAETAAEAPVETPVPVVQPDTVPSSGEQAAEADLTPRSFSVSATSRILRLLDDSGNIIDDTLSSGFEITGIGYVLVSSENPILSWTLNGVRIQPSSPVNEFRILNITSDLSIDITTSRASSADAVIDESHMCKVSCVGCTFSYNRGKLISVTEGEVPAGAPINVVADSSELAAGGYSINDQEPENAGKAGFRLIVNEDVTIVCK